MDSDSHKSTSTKLVYQANQIAAFFHTQAKDSAAAGVANHINMFWEPRMRVKFFAILEQENNGLDPLVIEAAELVRKPEATT
jgi:formate dehydrogenase subunit delta